MKFFIDSADVKEIRQAQAMGLAEGVTTNPTLLARQGAPLEKTIREIAGLVEGPVNAEVSATSAGAIIEEGRRFAGWGKNVHVKIPLDRAGLVACKALSSEGIPCTMTLIFSPAQAILAARAGAAWICPFVGRLDDIAADGIGLVRTVAEIYSGDADGRTKILAASVRGPAHVVEAALAGADAVTVPFAVIEKMERHPLTEKGIAQFLADARKIGS
ncbi:MAG: transaldolase family protein [Acidobacteriota bacterium]